jgi:hypothetical protein
VFSSIGRFLMLNSIDYNPAFSIIIVSRKSWAVFFRDNLFSVGVIGITVVVKILPLFGKYLIYRPHTACAPTF